jgi:hypothetical protein
MPSAQTDACVTLRTERTRNPGHGRFVFGMRRAVVNAVCKSIIALAAIAVVVWAGQDKGPRSTRWPILPAEMETCSSFGGLFPCTRRPHGHPGGSWVTTLMDDFF